MKLNYGNQVILTVVLAMLGNTFGTLYGRWEIFSAGFWLAGLLWVFHPVVSEDMPKSKAFLMVIRLIGVMILALGILKVPAVNELVAGLLG